MKATTQTGTARMTPDNSTHTAEGLLGARNLLLAVAGNLQGASPLIGWARELADLHATLNAVSEAPIRRPADFDDAGLRDRITVVIGLIDEWSVFHLPRTTTGRRHTHSLGEVISHVADTYAQLQQTLRHNDSAQDQHHATLRFAQIQEGYASLVDEIRALRVALPAGRLGIRSTE
ncbi:hypothetical protein [Nocardia sp. NPDC051832]|uniref:hypothetical protein n=1 Tax=Nocardia sp. NPDC051832 TaxID=3155673 RepID=UPI00342372A8